MGDRNRPRVGVAAIVSGPDKRVLVGRRKGGVNTPGRGHWGFPGGHLEYGEEVLACAERETLEETGLAVRAVKIAAVTSSVFVEAGLHYITLFVACEMVTSTEQPRVMEPDKCETWLWKSWGELRAMAAADEETDRLFLPIAKLLAEHPGLEDEVASVRHL